MCSKKSALLLFILVGLIPIFCQAYSVQLADNEPVGKFLNDTIKVGQPVEFSLSYRHPIGTQVIFPDSNFNFSPFEYVGKTYFPTISDSATSLDSVVYTLISFETLPKLELSLPVFELNGTDSIANYSNVGSVTITPVIKKVPEEVDLRSNSKLLIVDRRFNYPYVFIAFGVLLILSLLIFVVFGVTIKRYYELSTLSLRQRRFEIIYARLLKQWETKRTSDVLEIILSSWKAHLERIENKTYSAFTSKEIVNLLPEYQLKEKLQTIDANIYGINGIEVPTSHLTYLLKISKILYKKRKEHIKNARRNK